jgi:hypothetical protein
MTDMKIIQARYGPIEYGQWVDVKPVLEGLNAIEIPVNDASFPAFSDWGDKKRVLRIVSERDDGSRIKLELKEGEIFETGDIASTSEKQHGQGVKADDYAAGGLVIHAAHYGTGPTPDDWVDVTFRLRELVRNNSLDIVVNNSTLVPNNNPFRGKKKQLVVEYSYDGGDVVTATRDEKDWLIIGQVQRELQPQVIDFKGTPVYIVGQHEGGQVFGNPPPMTVSGPSGLSLPTTPAALNDYLIRKFSISPQRLRAPMPIELRDFHRNDLAQLFTELGFKRGVEVGVAEGNYSEVLLKANPECELLLVDPWHAYSENPQNKTESKHTFAYTEALRKTKGYRVMVMQDYSMNAVRELKEESLDFCYIDGNHLFDYVMQDLIEWSKRVRSGGIVSGDDYYALDQKRWVGGGVVEAVNAYVGAHGINPWFIFSGHKSTDFFWIKP